jgi:hypothetical protein
MVYKFLRSIHCKFLHSGPVEGPVRGFTPVAPLTYQELCLIEDMLNEIVEIVEERKTPVVEDTKTLISFWSEMANVAKFKGLHEKVRQLRWQFEI